jgi:rod shape determining protein RodA
MAIRSRLRLPPLDMPLLLAALALACVGLLMVYSATSTPGAHQGLWTRQLVWAGIALAMGWVVASSHYRAYDALAWPLYVIAIGLLVLVLVKGVGVSAMGAKRWLDLGPLHFQPSELAKVATVILLARRFDKEELDLRRLWPWLSALLIVLIPFALVAKEPDLGTSLTFPVILIAMYFWAGMPVGQLLLGLSPVLTAVLFFLTGGLWWSAGLVVLPLVAGLVVMLLVAVRPRLMLLAAVIALNVGVGYALPHVWNHMHDYQKRRIVTFMNPGQDPYRAGYQIIQSRIAIGSGGLKGTGYLKGTQKGLAFLPMRHTDFIFSVVGEEWGLLGTVTVVLLYALLVLRGFRLALAARSRFASLLAVGVVSALFYHIMVNILMTIGWAPVTGLPLPFISYGGTALVANGIQMGLLQSVALRRTEM